MCVYNVLRQWALQTTSYLSLFVLPGWESNMRKKKQHTMCTLALPTVTMSTSLVITRQSITHIILYCLNQPYVLYNSYPARVYRLPCATNVNTFVTDHVMSRIVQQCAVVPQCARTVEFAKPVRMQVTSLLTGDVRHEQVYTRVHTDR